MVCEWIGFLSGILWVYWSSYSRNTDKDFGLKGSLKVRKESGFYFLVRYSNFYSRFLSLVCMVVSILRSCVVVKIC